MPNAAEINSQVNLIRNGDFRHYVNRTISGAPGSKEWPPLIAHWSLSGVGAPHLATTVIEQATIADDEPHRYLRLRSTEELEQKVISRDFFTRPSLKEFPCTVVSFAGGILQVSSGATDAWIISEPSPAPLSAISRSMNVGDEVQIVNHTNPDATGIYRAVEVVSATTLRLVPENVPDASVNSGGDSLTVLRRLNVFGLELTVFYTIPTGQPASDLLLSLFVEREKPMADDTLLLADIVTGGTPEIDSVALSGNAIQIVGRFRQEYVRAPRGIRLNFDNISGGTADLSDVGLYIGNYHLPVATTTPPPPGTIVTPVIPGPDHMHMLAGRGDLILLRAGSQAPEGYKKLKEEIAFYESSGVVASYDAGTDTTTFTLSDWAVPPSLGSSTYEIVFQDDPIVAPGKPGPLDVSVRITDVEIEDNTFGGAQIDLAGLLAGETVTLDVPTAGGPVVFTEGVDFSNAATLAGAIIGDATLSQDITATAIGTIVEVRTLISGWSNTSLAPFTVSDTVTGADWEQIGGGALSPAGQLNLLGGKTATFTARGDMSPRTGQSAFIVATAPLRADSESSVGNFRKPTLTGFDAVEDSSIRIEAETDGIQVGDILTFTDDEGDPLPALSGNGPSFKIITIDRGDNFLTVADVNGAVTNVSPYVIPNVNSNRYVVEKNTGKHNHYAGGAQLDERELEAGGANSNTARGFHGHNIPADDAIPPYRKFVICEKI